MPDSKLYEILGVSRNANDQEIKKVLSLEGTSSPYVTGFALS